MKIDWTKPIQTIKTKEKCKIVHEYTVAENSYRLIGASNWYDVVFVNGDSASAALYENIPSPKVKPYRAKLFAFNCSPGNLHTGGYLVQN